jgi:hypothetical protein
MSEYVAEAYLSMAREGDLPLAAERARAVARQLTDRGVPVHHLRSIFLRSEETCFHFFEAPSVGNVRVLLMRAGLDFERISPVVTAEAP